jgi:hypothetical protein
MINDWSLRSEVLAISHRWPLPLLAFLVGCILGVGASVFLPTTFRAETSLDVAYNGDLLVRNPDDFKNWQMGQLNLFIESREILGDTLARLRRRDAAYWNGISARDLETHLHVYWRNAGEWRLVAENADAERATLLAEIWRDVAMEKIDLALFHAAGVSRLEAQQRAIARAHVDIKLRLVELAQLRDAMQAWQAASTPDGQSQPLSTLERWRLLDLAGKVADLDMAGAALLEDFPSAEAPAQEYLDWVDQALISIENEIAVTDKQSASLNSQYGDVTKRLDDSIKASHGLTMNLAVKPFSVETGEIRRTWNRADAALVGGLLGIVAWGLLWLAVPVLREKK